MQRAIRIITIGYFATLLLSFLSFDSSFSQNISIDDYRIPASKSQRWKLALSGSLEKNNDDRQIRYNLPPSLVSSSTTSNFGNLNFSTLYNSFEFDENHSNEIWAALSSSLRYDNRDGDQWSGSSQTKNVYESRYESADASVVWNYSSYVIPDEWYVVGALENTAHYDFTRNYSLYEYVGQPPIPDNETRVYKNRRYSMTASAGAGLGKVRDGATVFAVLRILDKLQEDGALTRELTREEILDITQIFAKQSEYTYSQDRFLKYFFTDLLSKFESMGVVKDNRILTYSVLRATEVLGERIESRIFGSRISLRLKHSYWQGTNDNPYDVRRFSKFAEDFYSVSAEYGCPISINAHFHTSASIDIPTGMDKDQINTSFYSSYIYQVGERVDAGLMYRFLGLTVPFNNRRIPQSINHGLDLRFTFFIENDISFGVSTGYTYTKYDGAENSIIASDGYKNSSTHVIFDLSYRLQ